MAGFRSGETHYQFPQEQITKQRNKQKQNNNKEKGKVKKRTKTKSCNVHGI